MVGAATPIYCIRPKRLVKVPIYFRISLFEILKLRVSESRDKVKRVSKRYKNANRAQIGKFISFRDALDFIFTFIAGRAWD